MGQAFKPTSGTAHEGFAKTAQALLRDIEGLLKKELEDHPVHWIHSYSFYSLDVYDIVYDV